MSARKRLRRNDPDSAHDFIARAPDGTLVVDAQPRGGLLVQVGVERGGGSQWNFVHLPKRFADQLRKFLARKP